MTRKPDSAFLREAAQVLHDVAPQIEGPLSGLADPVAEWLERHAENCDILWSLVPSVTPEDLDHPAFRVARAVLGRES